MHSSPWMKAMLGELLATVESDPTLRARLQRLIIAPSVDRPPVEPTEPIEVDWIAELMPIHFAATSANAPVVSPPKTTPEAAPTPAPTVAPAVTVGKPAAPINPPKTARAITAPKSAQPISFLRPGAVTKAMPTVAPKAAVSIHPPKPATKATPAPAPVPAPFPPVQIPPYVQPWLPAIPMPADVELLQAKRRPLAAVLRSADASSEHHAASRLPAGTGQDLPPPAKLTRSLGITEVAAPAASANKLAELQQNGVGGRVSKADTRVAAAVPESVRVLQRLPLALADAAVVASELACGRPHPGLPGVEWLQGIHASRRALEELAEAYWVAGLTPELLLSLPTDNAGLEGLLQAIATTQAWLHGRVMALEGHCLWQLRLFEAVTRISKERRIYIKRHLKLADAPSRHEFEKAAKQLSRFTDRADTALNEPANRRNGGNRKTMTPRTVSAEVREVARLLAGRTVVMIGGDHRTERVEPLRATFGLRNLRWLPTDEHDSTEPLHTAAAASDVSLVLLLIRWASHAYGGIIETCKRRDIPLVRVPSGYSANQLAHQILEQAGARLRALPPPAG